MYNTMLETGHLVLGVVIVIKTLCNATSTQKYNVNDKKKLMSMSTEINAIRSAMECAAICSKVESCSVGSYNKDTRKCQIFEGNTCAAKLGTDVNSKVMKKANEVNEVKKESCDTNWVLFNGHCYFFGNTGFNWTESQDECKKKGSNLVKIETQQENTWIKNTLRGKSVRTKCWTGANDLKEEGEWTWVSDDCALTYTDWNRREPDNWNNKEHCAAWAGDVNMWVDLVCTGKWYFICET